MNVVDAHFHVWRQADLPWLAGAMQPRIFGPYEAIRRDYPMSEYRADAEASGVSRAVYVQANWPVERAEDEAEWIERTASETGWPHGFVGYADMTSDDVRPALERMSRFPRLRGIRQQFHWHQKPEYRFASHADLCRDDVVQKNVGRLADYDLAFDLQVFAPQMSGAAELARSCPDVTLVLQHAGMLEDTSEAGRLEWRAAMQVLADCPNVVVKISGFGTFVHRLDHEHIRWMTSETVALFGAERCLWGSNFPIEKLWTQYDSLLDAHRAAAGGLSTVEQQSIFNDTARRVYRLT